ncbi:MAG TPA: hypothetical protein VFZ56_10795 [Gemmatimonadaceae bacterium]
MRNRVLFRVLLSAGTLLTAVVLVSWSLDTHQWADRPRLALVLVPVVVAMWTIYEYVRMVRTADEFQRRVMLESFAIAFPVALLLGMTVEYLQKGGFMMGIDVGRLWPVQALVWAVALFYAYWRYR